MLHTFVALHRTQLIERCRSKRAHRPARGVVDEEEQGVGRFLDQLVCTLEAERSVTPIRGRAISGASGGAGSGLSEMGTSAARHASHLFDGGATVDQVVHEYGDLCQAITDLAFEEHAVIEVDEFRTLNRCLDNAIAVAVTEFAQRCASRSASEHATELAERLGFLAHELRNMLSTATLALTLIKSGRAGWAGATADVLDRSFAGLRRLIDRSLTQARMAAGSEAQRELVSLHAFIDEVKVSASLDAQMHGCELSVGAVDPALAIEADRHLLSSALSNVLQNAFKFTQRLSTVTLEAHAAGERILIEVADHCGGLAGGDIERMFLPFAQTGSNRTGVGLGLTLARLAVEANAGTLSARDIPSRGCVFTISLPRRTLPLATAAAIRAPVPDAGHPLRTA